jgi:meso-butanediol dehydrogenase/(S,S)-butanediol dehydrogenase/diacetyl reductase
VSAIRRFEDKVIVVTGAARGLGRGIAGRFAGEGGKVLLVDRDPTVKDTATELASSGLVAEACQADVTAPDDVQQIFRRVRDLWDRLDVLINNAGVITISRLEDLSIADWNKVLTVNTTGAFLCCQAAAGLMREKRNGGRMLNAASGQARQGFIYTPHYAASKFGVVGLTQSLARNSHRTASRSTRTLPASSGRTCGRTTTANGAGCWVTTRLAS